MAKTYLIGCCTDCTQCSTWSEYCLKAKKALTDYPEIPKLCPLEDAE